MEIFKKTQAYDPHLVNKVRKVLQSIYISFIFQTGVGPFLYAITNNPDPEKWLAKFQLK